MQEIEEKKKAIESAKNEPFARYEIDPEVER